MIKNGFSNPSKFLSKEELMMIEEERLRTNLLDTNQLLALQKAKEGRLSKLQTGRNLNDEERREVQRLEHDLLMIDEKKMEIGIRF